MTRQEVLDLRNLLQRFTDSRETIEDLDTTQCVKDKHFEFAEVLLYKLDKLIYGDE